MHIEPGLVSESKIWLSYATAAGCGAYTLKLAVEALKQNGAFPLIFRSISATALVFVFFEVLPHHPVGVSEVHLILGTTLFLLFGAAPAGLGLAVGLLVQSLSFAPADLPQYGINVTTLLVPLFAMREISLRIVEPATPYVDLSYRQLLVLSTIYQSGIVTWVAFWAVYGRGVEVENLASIAMFGGAYLLVIIIEPMADIAALAIARMLRDSAVSFLVERRLYNPV